MRSFVYHCAKYFHESKDIIALMTDTFNETTLIDDNKELLLPQKGVC